MDRTALQDLYQWKSSPIRKPLIIRGARQVGKTWLMKEFGQTAYENVVYISFDNNPLMEELFSPDFNMERIITGLELYAGHKITPGNTLLIFDEIQEIPLALTALKYFNENAPQYQILCAGSLLGIALHPGTSFPVGKVEFLDLYPLSFSEFMLAMGQGRLVEILQKRNYDLLTVFKQHFIDLLKYYFYVGGMPEVVASFIAEKDFNQARAIQQRILTAYEQDFSKHAPHAIVPRIRSIWNNIPAQLARENKKFIYGIIKKGARAKDYETALLWLSDCGLVHQVNRVNTPRLPLRAYQDLKAFKLFLVDVGLLSCMVRLDQHVLLDGNHLFVEFKGALTEQYVFQQLRTQKGIEPFYWTNDHGTAEVNFVIDSGAQVIPVEVKSETNLRSKNLRTYFELFHPQMSVRTSMANYKQENWLLNLPLYAIELLLNTPHS
ncbi:MAG: ATP-binding protein [Chloroflexi bacterium]|nr:ATP-binding protein [Chloroflexota bacterium]